ncbi:hypothetical protein SESBI_11570 [Sesbania bispinosa]|nr:hypothetical protein SESBI_11570 [Sesbania bispinosa]
MEMGALEDLFTSFTKEEKANSMILKDLMEEKQLNFNQPLLSVRRFSSTVASETDNKRKTDDNSLANLPALPPYKSELKSGPVRNAGTVPFVWEKIPGRPKDESKLQIETIEEPPLITPNLPPGRVSKIKQQDYQGTIVTEMRTRSNVSNSQNVTKARHESSKEEFQEKEITDLDDGDETYQDALDTLSRTESFFMTCSVSDLSGWGDQEVQFQSSGRFSSDQHSHDFMIDRFFPAAKAMTSETPQYASRKPLARQEQQKQLKKTVSTERTPPVNQHSPKALRHYIQDIGGESSEDEGDDTNGSKNYTTTACGLLPRFCLLNPIPGLRMEDKVQNNAVRGMQTKSNAYHIVTTKVHARPPHYGKKSVDSKSHFTKEKEIWGILEKSKHGTDPLGRGCLSACESTQGESTYESPIVEKTLYVDSVQKVKSETDHRGDNSEALRRESGIYNNPSTDSSLENSKQLDVVNLKAALKSKSSESLDSPSLICSEISNNGMQMERKNHSMKIDSEKQGLTKPGNQESDLDKDLVVISSPKVVECKKIDLETQVSISEKNSGILTQDSEVDLKNVSQECTLASSKVGDDNKIDLESQCLMKLGLKETPDAGYFQIPLVLPSLKAPSESWLKRTLPTISSRNISSHSNHAANIYARSQASKTATLHPKWETIVVKSSNTHHGHLQLPEVIQ